MKSTDNKEKELRELSEEELKNVTGGLAKKVKTINESHANLYFKAEELGITE